MIVCVCRRISDHDIRRAVRDGAATLECLQFELGVALQCGQCADCAERVLCEARRDSVAANAAQAVSGAVIPIVPVAA